MSGGRIPFEQIQAAALTHAAALLASWFPNGKRVGREFRIGNIAGDRGESLRVNVDSGLWKDFADNVSGHDLIDLRAAILRTDRVTAARELGDMLGVHPNGQDAARNSTQGARKPADDWRPMVPPPADAGRPPDAMLAGFDIVHEYTDASDRVTHYVGRIEARGGRRKSFVPVTFGTLGGKVGWHKKAPSVPRPLYGLNRLATMPDASVFVCEGEKAADAAQELFPDRACVSWFGGTESVEHTDLSPLRGRTIVLWPDNDGPGAKAAAALAAKLPHARVLRVDDLPDGGDAADIAPEDPEAWLKERLAPDGPEVAEAGIGPLVLSTATPMDSAREMVRRLYVQPGARTIHHQQSDFYRWRGTHFTEIPPEEIRADIYHFLDAAKQLGKDNKLLPFNPNKAKTANVFEALAAVAQLDGTIRAPAWLDDKPHPSPTDIMACANGLLHLPTRKLLPHTPTFFSLNAVDYDYDSTVGEAAAWLDFLHSIWPGDQESIDTLQELFGLLLTADTSHQKAFLIVGPKRSGKGTIARVLKALLGKENVVGPTLSGLSQNFGLQALIGKPLAIISDARLSGRADAHTIAERVLAITGEDTLSVDRKFRDAWTGQLPTRFLILTNELPRLTDASGTLASRFIIMRLTESFYGREDRTLTGRLITELSAILQWAMAGRDRLAERGHFLQPTSAAQEADELHDLASPVGAFVRQRCVVNPLDSLECGLMFDAWLAWCRENGHDHPGTTHMFSRNLRAAVPSVQTEQKRDPANYSERLRLYTGIALLPP